FRLWIRPKKSISHDAFKPTEYVVVIEGLSGELRRSAGVRVRLPDAGAWSVGKSPVRTIRYCAADACMFNTDTRRSRLFFNAISISSCKRGSTKNSRQPMSVAFWPFALRAPGAPGAPGCWSYTPPLGKVADVGSAGRS